MTDVATYNLGEMISPSVINIVANMALKQGYPKTLLEGDKGAVPPLTETNGYKSIVAPFLPAYSPQYEGMSWRSLFAQNAVPMAHIELMTDLQEVERIAIVSTRNHPEQDLANDFKRELVQGIKCVCEKHGLVFPDKLADYLATK